MRVYRIEDHFGGGPYSSGPGPIDWCNIKHPTPVVIRKRFYDVIPPDYYFGFCSMKALKEWFSIRDRRRLDARKGQYDFFVSVYEVAQKYVVKEDKQCVFVKKKSKFINDIDLMRI